MTETQTNTEKPSKILVTKSTITKSNKGRGKKRTSLLYKNQSKSNFWIRSSFSNFTRINTLLKNNCCFEISLIMPQCFLICLFTFVKFLAYEEIGTGYENVDLITEENDVRYNKNTLKLKLT